jgi:ribonucleoside-diphosphate reductase alpha chain
MMRQGSMVNVVYKVTGDKRFKIISTNACSEKPLSPYAVCNLGSINMEMFSIEPEKFKEELDNIVPLLVRFQDNVVEYELQYDKSPIKEQQ